MVSEENNDLQENSEHNDSKTPEESFESQLQSRAAEFLAGRIAPVKAEIERLQATIAEISESLASHAGQEPSEDEGGFFDHLRQWFTETKSRAEEEFQSKLEAARQEWDSLTRQSIQDEFEKRLETSCAEAAAVARRDAEAQAEDLREQLEASRKALKLAVSSAQTASAQQSAFEDLRSGVIEIDDQRTQSDTLTALVKSASRFAPRVVFFVVKGGDAVGWKANGFENGLNDETVRLIKVPTHTPTLLRDALTGFTTASGRSSSPGDNFEVLGIYGSPAPERAIAVPLVIRGKAAAVLYADSGTKAEDSINVPAIELLIDVASMGIELLPARRGLEPTRPAPDFRKTVPIHAEDQQTEVQEDEKPTSHLPALPVQAEEPSEPEEQADEDQVKPDRITEDLVMPEGVEEQLEAAESQVAQPAEIEAEPVEEVEEVEAYEPETVEAEAAEVVDEVPPPPPAPPYYNNQESAESSAPTEQIRTTRDYPDEGETAPAAESPFFPSDTVPKQATPIPSVPAPASETEQRAHNDARRFARLLVSEIKLYNAAKVNEGRRNFDLYDRLKDEIDRSRKVYDKRVSPAVATRFDYFYDELVQTLAEGDPAKLGPECPGPVVIAS